MPPHCITEDGWSAATAASVSCIGLYSSATCQVPALTKVRITLSGASAVPLASAPYQEPRQPACSCTVPTGTGPSGSGADGPSSAAASANVQPRIAADEELQHSSTCCTEGVQHCQHAAMLINIQHSATTLAGTRIPAGL
jgi:hypothetical protein